MLKWFEQSGNYKDVVISTRVRLARNLKKYPFAAKLNDDTAKELVNEVCLGFKNYHDQQGSYLAYRLNELSEIDRLAMMEHHIISPHIAQKQQNCGLLVCEDESASIMVNEEDHLRIQTLTGGMNIKDAFIRANEIDDALTEKFDIAFDEKYGYLTSCPTNVGTGLRVSYMMFLPALSAEGKINRLASEASKYGVTLRGLYGEGSKSVASIYQVSNQKTLGISEHDIIEGLGSIVLQIIKQEQIRREYVLSKNYNSIEEQVYRSYGILKYTKHIDLKDAMTLLAQVKLGIDAGILKVKSSASIYKMMMNSQPSCIQYRLGQNAGSEKRERLRAEYINQNLPELIS